MNFVVMRGVRRFHHGGGGKHHRRTKHMHDGENFLRGKEAVRDHAWARRSSYGSNTVVTSRRS
jgi:hypothetical protein